jgi:thymidylate synthase
MNLLTARNADAMLPLALNRLLAIGVRRESRNGPVLQMPGPTLLCYEQPLERVVFWPERNANPFFHVIEAMWMLAGRNDVAGIAPYAANIKQYSDDGEIFHGAYGYRWRRHFGTGHRIDQLEIIIEALRRNPDCRRQVLSMWDAEVDFAPLKDLPCNTHAYFQRDANGALDMTVCNRSNDLVWGALGANAVHFSFLHEYMALRIGCPVGRYYQFTNNLHGYLNTLEPVKVLADNTGLASNYEIAPCDRLPLFGRFSEAEFELDLFRLGNGGYVSDFFTGVVAPMEKAWAVYKTQGPGAAVPVCSEIKADDWRQAATEWMKRCYAKRQQKAADDGVNYE